MSDVQVRPFRRSDRDQLTQLVNAHAEAVVPGMSASVNTVLSSLERQPGEFIEDPWVSERVTLVAEQRSRVAAAAHLLRYFPDERAGAAAPRRRRDLLAAVLAAGPGRQPVLAGRDRGGGGADSRVHRGVRPLGRHPPVRRRGTAGARRVRGAGAVAARRRALPAGRVHPHRAHRGRLPGPGRGPARSGPAAATGWRCAGRSGSTAAACPPCSARR